MNIDRFTVGQLRAFASIVTGDNEDLVGVILRREAKVSVEEVVLTFFDKHGRRIPPRGIKGAVCDANRKFHLVQPETIDFTARLERVNDAFKGTIKLPDAVWFEDEVGRLKALVEGNDQIANAMKGVWLPTVIPNMTITDYGQLLDDLLLPALERSYEVEFPNRQFNNHRKGALTRQITVVEVSRLNELVERAAHSPVVTLDFLCATQGFSVHAQREQMATLPEGLILDGFNAICRAIMWPDVVCRDFNTPVDDLSAYKWRSAGCSLYLESDFGFCGFGYRADLGSAVGGCSGGLSFLG